MTAQLAPDAIAKFFDNNGAPLAFGLLTTFAAGTTTPQATYVDSTQTTQNTNPIVLNFRGECNLWLDQTKTYKFLLQDSLGNTIPGWPVDNIPGSTGVITTNTAFKSSPTSVTSSTTLIVDPDLNITITRPGIYSFEAVLFLSTTGSSGTTPGASIGLFFSGSTVSAGNSYVTAGLMQIGFSSVAPGGQAINYPLVTGSNPGTNAILMKGSIDCTTAGTFSIQWAQQNSSASAVNMGAGSYLVITRMTP